MLKVTNELKGLDIELELTDDERGVLSASVQQRGFEIMQRIMEDQVRKFNFKLLDTNPAKQDEVLAAHFIAKGVAQFYTALMEKINDECGIHAYTNRKPTVENATEIPELQ
jgi:hypothetical protein